MSTEPKPTQWVSLFIFLLTGYVFVFGQARFTAFRDLLGFQLDLIPGLVVYGAIQFQFLVMLFSAGFLGLLLDTLSANPLGTAALSLMIVAVLAFYFRELLLSEQFTARFILGTGATAASIFLSLIILYVAGEQPLVGIWTLWHALLMSAGGGIFTPLWFVLFNRLDDALRYKEMPEPSFRPDREIARGRHY